MNSRDLQRRLDDAHQVGYVTGFSDGQRIGPGRPGRVLLAFLVGIVLGLVQRFL